MHVDLDAFFASVEMLDDPSLAGRPVAVGGAGERGVIASASYEARRYGVRSAMASVTARRLCPALIILPGRFDRYEEYSKRFHRVINDLTPHYEALGLDEVFADLRGLRRLGVDPLGAAEGVRQRLREELGLRSGIGLARNKLFAKLASKESKPRVVGGRLEEGTGVFWVSPDQESRWLATLPVRALWGVGPATAAKLSQLGLRYVRDLARVDEATLARHFGPAMAASLSAYARGEDPREVIVDRPLKSVGRDETFAKSLSGLEEVSRRLREHAAVVARALRAKALVARTITVGVRFDDLTQVSRSQTLSFGLDDEDALFEVASALLQGLDLSRAVRLLALHASGFLERGSNAMQLSFGFEESASDAKVAAASASLAHQVERTALRDAIDEIRRRFGQTSVASLAELGEEGLAVARQRGSHAFGPGEGAAPTP